MAQDWKDLLRQTQAEKGGIGLAALQRAKDMGASLSDINSFLKDKPFTLGAAAQQSRFAPVAGAKQALTQAAPGGISKTELEQIARRTGVSTNTLVKRIDEMNKAGKDIRPNSGAFNMLIKQALTKPAYNQPDFGTGNFGRALTIAMGSPGYTPPRSPNGGTMGQPVAAIPPQLMKGGQQLRPGGRPTNIPQINPLQIASTTPAASTTPTTDTTPTTPEVVNPYQDAIDAILGDLASTRTAQAEQNQYFQDIINQTQMQATQQAQDLNALFNQYLTGIQDEYAMQIQQQNQLAQQEQEAARAFMINQGRMMNPANLQIGAYYGTPQLAGTQGFKAPTRRDTITPAQAATAFTAPTLAATAATTPMMTTQPTVLNV